MLEGSSAGQPRESAILPADSDRQLAAAWRHFNPSRSSTSPTSPTLDPGRADDAGTPSARRSSPAEQLDADVAAIDAMNDRVSRATIGPSTCSPTPRACPSATTAKAWEKWFVNQVGYAAMTPDEKPTVVEDVAIAYQPRPSPMPGVHVLRASPA